MGKAGRAARRALVTGGAAGLAAGAWAAMPPVPLPPLPGEPSVPLIVTQMCAYAPQPPASGLRPLTVLAKFGFDGTIGTAYACMAGPPARRYRMTVKVVLLNQTGQPMSAGSLGPLCGAPAGIQSQWAACSAPRFALTLRAAPACPRGAPGCALPGMRPATARVTVTWHDSLTGPPRREEFGVPVRAI